MSRPASSKGSKKGKRGSAKTPKKQIAELTEQNNSLTNELNSMRNENDTLKIKLETMVMKMLEVLPKKAFQIKENMNYTEVPLDTLVEMMGKLIVKKKLQEMSVEARIEELETRVTQMSMDIAKMTKKTMAYENGLQDLLKMNDLNEVHDQVYHLQLIAGNKSLVFFVSISLSVSWGDLYALIRIFISTTTHFHSPRDETLLCSCKHLGHTNLISCRSRHSVFHPCMTLASNLRFPAEISVKASFDVLRFYSIRYFV